MDYKKINDYEVVYLVKENDEEARKIIFNKYIPIVRKLASKYSMSAKWARVDFDDLVQEGLIALNDAIDKYDENSGALFYTFACICVERRTLTFCRKMSSNKHYYLNTSFLPCLIKNTISSAPIVQASAHRLFRFCPCRMIFLCTALRFCFIKILQAHSIMILCGRRRIRSQAF